MRIGNVLVLWMVVQSTTLTYAQKDFVNCQQVYLTQKDSLVINKVINFFEESNRPRKINEYKTIFREDLEQLKNLFCFFKKKNADSREYALLSFTLGHMYLDLTEAYNLRKEYFYQANDASNNLTTVENFKLNMILGDEEKINNNYISALHFFDKALTLSKELESNAKELICIREIGVVHTDMEDYDQALEYLLLANKEAKNIPDFEVEQFWIDMHLGNLFRLKKDFKNAEYHLLKANKNRVAIKEEPFIEAHGIQELGTYFKDTGQLDSARYYFNKVINITNTFPLTYNNYTQIESLDELGNIALMEKDTVKAIHFYQKAFNNGRVLGGNRTIDGVVEKMYPLIKPNDSLRDVLSQYLFTVLVKQKKENEKSRKKFAYQMNDIQVKNKKLIEQERQQKQIVIIVTILFPCLFIFFIGFLTLRRMIVVEKDNKKKLKVLNNELKASNTKLKNLNIELDNFSSFVAHDIKSSIISIQFGIHQMINQRNIKDKKQQKTASLIYNETKDLYELVDNLLFKAKNPNKRRTLPEPINVSDLLQNIKDSFLNNGREKATIKIKANNKVFNGHKIDLIRLFRNLIENAIKYRHHDRFPIIEITVKKQNSKLSVRVIDNGRGIPLEKQNEIFLRFKQSRETDIFRGSGIGLKICKTIASQYKGSLRVKSHPGKGSTFFVDLFESP